MFIKKAKKRRKKESSKYGLGSLSLLAVGAFVVAVSFHGGLIHSGLLVLLACFHHNFGQPATAISPYPRPLVHLSHSLIIFIFFSLSAFFCSLLVVYLVYTFFLLIYFYFILVWSMEYGQLCSSLGIFFAGMFIIRNLSIEIYFWTLAE